jgi:hypothetical protein
METVLINGMTKEDFLFCIREIIREEIILSSANSRSEDEFISSKELQRLFTPSISRVSIDNWCKKGLLNKIYFGRKVYFKKADVLKSIQTLKRYNITQ